jgi:hypothetical protein
MTIKTVNHVLIHFCQRSPEVEHLKDPPTRVLAAFVGGSFRARHHDVSEPGEAKPEPTGDARFEIQNLLNAIRLEHVPHR